MKKERLSISSGALLLGALIYCTASFSELAAILAPVIVHELGHILTLRLYGLRIRCVRAELRGLCIEYGGVCAPMAGSAHRWDTQSRRSRARRRASDTPSPPRPSRGGRGMRC